jgi:sugar phosphate isomerase/epimerase
MRFAICLEMIFPDLPFLERARRVQEAGFSAVEFWGWGGKDLDALCGLVDGGLAVATFSGQRRGSLVDPRDRETYREKEISSRPCGDTSPWWATFIWRMSPDVTSLEREN